MKHLSKIHYLIFTLIFLSLLMNYVYFANTGNLNSPIIEYELVKNTNDVKKILTQNNEFKKDVIQGINNQNIVDYAYMFVYTTLLILVFIKVHKFENKKIYNIGVVFAIFALITDIIENIQLFNISELLALRNDFSAEIKILIIATSIKWLSLGFAMFILSFHYFKNKIIGKLFSLLSAIPLFIAIYYIFNKSLAVELYYTSSIMLDFIVLMVWAFISKYINNNISFYKTYKE